MKKLKIMITLIIIIIIILVICLFLQTKKDTNNYNNVLKNSIVNEAQIEEDLNFKVDYITGNEKKLKEYSKVEITNDFFTVENLINLYYYHIYNKEYETLFNTLSKEYISKNNINLNNIINNVSKMDVNILFYAKDMYWVEGDTINTFSIYGEVWNEYQTKILKKEYFIVELDKVNNTYAITPCIKNNYANIEQINISRNNGNIEKNDYNNYVDENLSTEEMAQKYFNYFKLCLTNYPEYTYNNLIDPEYKEKRFKDLKDFNEYKELNDFIIFRSKLEKYAYIENNNEYSIIDNYNNNITIKAKYPMNFKVLLDNYTIRSTSYLSKYLSMSEEQKYSEKITEFTKMVNSKDYKSIYNHLNKTFKNNNFNNLELFKKYFLESFYEYNLFEVNNISNKEGYYVYDITVINEYINTETKNMNLIIKLGEGTDFELSFSFI